jgi:hypothetical protein
MLARGVQALNLAPDAVSDCVSERRNALCFCSTGANLRLPFN